MKKLIVLFITFLIVFFLCFYKLDAYIMKPGSAYDVSQFVTVQNEDLDDTGSLSLMTVSMAPATPLTYTMAYFNEFEEIMKVEEVRQEEEDEDEYNVRQLKLMSNSQFNAIYVAFQKANLMYDITYNGITVLNVLRGGAADGKLKPGDEIVELDGERVGRADELTKALNRIQEDEEVKLVIKRKDELIDQILKVKEIPGTEGEKVGLGITYSENKTISTDPRVKVNTEDIGGPSAGLMFTLEILDQILDEDITKGYAIAGTGEMNEDGTVGRIGGIEKKVVAADKDGMEIFFAPDDEISEHVRKMNPSILSNYEAAVQTAEKIGTDMKIVPVKNIDDAIEYLKQLPSKDLS